MRTRIGLAGYGGTLLAALTMTGAAPEAALGQERPMYELPPVTVVALSEADELHLQAIALYEYPERWLEAARLHERAASKLPEKDARSFAAYDRAARLYFYAGDYMDARKDMEKAANVALATGDVVTAAHAYIDAAFITLWEGPSGKLGELTRKAELLSQSDLVDDEDRDEIRSRISRS
jgi:tetratricopeptide (TPR) repeat protein